MTEVTIINSTGAALDVQGETTPAFTATDSTGAPTNDEQLALVATTGVALMKGGATAAQKAAIAACLLNSINAADFDLSTAAKRKQLRIKLGLDEQAAIIRALAGV